MTISISEPDQFDTADAFNNSGYKIAIYLDPEESCVVSHSGYGNIGWPERAHHNRWLHLATISHPIPGVLVAEKLDEFKEFLGDVAATYSTHFDPRTSTTRGRWELDPYQDDKLIDLRRALSQLTQYWDAAEYIENLDLEELTDELELAPHQVAALSSDDPTTRAPAIELVAEALNASALADGYHLLQIPQAIRAKIE